MDVATTPARRRGTEKTDFSMPLFPLANYLTIGGVILVFLAMLANPSERMTAIASLGTAVVCYGLATYFSRKTAGAVGSTR